MDRYVQQLLADIEAARLSAPQPWASLEDDDEDSPTGLPRIDAIHLAPTRSLEDWTGLTKVSLPPGTHLSDDQLECLLTALKDLLTAFQCHVVFQQRNVPLRLQYEVVRLRFHQKIPLVHANEHFFSFCDPGQDQSTCSLGSFCECSYLDKFLEENEAQEDNPISFSLPEENGFPHPDEAEAPEFYLRRKYGDEFFPGSQEDDDDFLGEAGESEWDGEEED